MDIDWNALLVGILPGIKRLGLISFMVLGVVYFFGRLVFARWFAPKDKKLSEQRKNRLAALSLFVISFAVTLVYDYGAMIDYGVMIDKTLNSMFWKYIVDSCGYLFFGSVFYVVVGWRFYSRMDKWFDKKWAPDEADRRKS